MIARLQPAHGIICNCLIHAMSPHSSRIRIAVSALTLALILTVFVVIRFATTSAQTETSGLNFPSLLLFPLVALPFLPGLFVP
jgi:hypothetical protein